MPVKSNTFRLLLHVFSRQMLSNIITQKRKDAPLFTVAASTPSSEKLKNSTHNEMESQLDADIPVASAPILMLSPPETQDTPQDVFHTPPEEASLPSSLDVEPCAINEPFFDFSGTQGSVDLSAFSQGSNFGKDSELGFSQAQPSQEIVTKLVPDCSQGSNGDGLGKVPDPHFEEVRVSDREISDLGESPAKKLKPLEQNLGKLVSDADEGSVKPQENVMGCEEMDVDDGKGEDFCREISVDTIITYDKKIETEIVQGNGDSKRKKSSDEVGEGSGMPPRGVLPISVAGEATTTEMESSKGKEKEKCDIVEATNEMESSEGKEKEKCDVFDILKALVEDTDDEEDKDDEDEDEDSVDGDNDIGSISLLKAVKKNGLTFPRPKWWPDHFKCKYINPSKTHPNVNSP